MHLQPAIELSWQVNHGLRVLNCSIMDYHHNFRVRMFTELAAINGTVFGIAVSALCAFGSIFLFTMSLRITSLAILFMMMIIVIVLGTFNVGHLLTDWSIIQPSRLTLQVIGWSIGVVEAITASIILGLSVDHIGHLCKWSNVLWGSSIFLLWLFCLLIMSYLPPPPSWGLHCHWQPCLQGWLQTIKEKPWSRGPAWDWYACCGVLDIFVMARHYAGESLVNASISTILCAGALTLAVIQVRNTLT